MAASGCARRSLRGKQRLASFQPRIGQFHEPAQRQLAVVTGPAPDDVPLEDIDQHRREIEMMAGSQTPKTLPGVAQEQTFQPRRVALGQQTGRFGQPGKEALQAESRFLPEPLDTLQPAATPPIFARRRRRAASRVRSSRRQVTTSRTRPGGSSARVAWKLITAWRSLSAKGSRSQCNTPSTAASRPASSGSSSARRRSSWSREMGVCRSPNRFVGRAGRLHTSMA